MAQASMKTVAVDALARRIVANETEMRKAREQGCDDAANDFALCVHEDRVLVALMGIERERAKKVTP